MQFVVLQKTRYLLNAIAENRPIVAKYFGIGIGSGTNESSSKLSKEVYRGTIQVKGRKLIDGTEYQHVTGFIPPSVSNVAITEIGLYDEQGNLLYYANVNPPIKLESNSLVVRLLHMMIAFDTEAAAIQFETGLTSLVEHNRDPEAHPDIREQLRNIESRLLPDDLYADIFSLMAGRPIANALTVIEFDPDSLQNENRAKWRPLRIRQTISPFTMIVAENEYDLKASEVFPKIQTIRTKYFTMERRVDAFDNEGWPTHIVYQRLTEPVTTLNPELKRIIAALGYPPNNFSMTIAYTSDTHFPQVITLTGDIDGTVIFSYDSSDYLNSVEINLLGGQIQASIDININVEDNKPSNAQITMPSVLVDLVRTTGCLPYGVAMLFNSLFTMFGFWQRYGLSEFTYTGTIETDNVKHILIINSFESEPAVYNYWAEDKNTGRLLRGYAQSIEYTFGQYTAIQRIHVLA